MTTKTDAAGSKGRVHALVDAILYRLSVYGVPVAIGLISLAALLTWKSQYPVGGAVPLGFSVLEQTGAELDPAQARAQLADRPTVMYFDTRLSEAPFWFSFSVPPGGAEGSAAVELPSRHATRAACWDAATLEPLGSGDRSGTAGRMKAVKAGFALDLGKLGSTQKLVCRGTFAGPARITVVGWSSAMLEASNRQFSHNAGLLEGGLIVLSVFVFVTAIINREWMYVLFAGWLMASLRLAAISAGWDTQWFEHVVPLAPAQDFHDAPTRGVGEGLEGVSMRLHAYA